jgi:hypothetical protein
MKIDEFLGQIPASMEYSFTLEKVGYRYFCYLKITNGSKDEKLNGSSNDLNVALQLLSENLKKHIAASRPTSIKSPA